MNTLEDRAPTGPGASRLRLLYETPAFAPAYRYGGPIRSAEGLVVALARLGVEVRTLTTDADGPDLLAVGPGWQAWRGVPVRYLRRWRQPDLAPAFLWESYLEARRVDVVHVSSFFSTPSMVGLGGAQLAGRPVVLSPRGALEEAALALASFRKKRAWLAAFGPLLRRVAIFHATSEAESASITRVLGPKARVRVVPNGTDLPLRDAALARKTRAALAPMPTIGALGRVHPIKALERLVEAGALLRDRGVDVALRFAGPTQDVRYAAELRGLAARLGVAERLEMPGELQGDAKLDFLASCRVLCLPSRSENFGNVVIEALASFTPVVASLGTPWPALDEQGAGRWVEGSPRALADALEPYLRDAAVAAAAGARGRRLVEQKYNWAAVASAMCDVYAEARQIGAGGRML